MPLLLGTQNFDDIKVGDTSVTGVRIGSAEVYAGAPVDYGYDFVAVSPGTGRNLYTSPGTFYGTGDFMFVDGGLAAVSLVTGAPSYQCRVHRRTSSGAPYDISGFPDYGAQGGVIDGAENYAANVAFFSSDGTKIYGLADGGVQRRYSFSGAPFTYGPSDVSRSDSVRGIRQVFYVSDDENVMVGTTAELDGPFVKYESSSGFADLVETERVTAPTFVSKIPVGDRLSGAYLSSGAFNSTGSVFLVLARALGYSPKIRLHKFYTSTPFSLVSATYGASYPIADMTGVNSGTTGGIRLMEDQNLLIIIGNQSVRTLSLTPAQ